MGRVQRIEFFVACLLHLQCVVLCCVLTVVGCGVVFHISLLLYYLFKIFKIVYDDDDRVWIVWIFLFLSCWGGL